MAEISIIAGKHSCGRLMKMKIDYIKDDNKEIFAWIIFGICRKCNIVMFSDLLLQEEEPVYGRDFIIDCNKTEKAGRKPKHLNNKYH